MNSKRSRMNIRRSKSFASGCVLHSERDDKARRIATSLDPITFACLQQLSMQYDLPISAIIRFAVEVYLTGNQDVGIARLAAKVKRSQVNHCHVEQAADASLPDRP